MTELILYLVLCMMLSIFFSGMETAFLSSSKLHFEMKRDNSLSARILSTYYRNPNHFISTMLVDYACRKQHFIGHVLYRNRITDRTILPFSKHDK